jgi:hypothetical protein
MLLFFSHPFSLLSCSDFTIFLLSISGWLSISLLLEYCYSHICLQFFQIKTIHLEVIEVQSYIQSISIHFIHTHTQRHQFYCILFPELILLDVNACLLCQNIVYFYLMNTLSPRFSQIVIFISHTPN